MNKLIITYSGKIKTITVEVETPLEISCQAEENVWAVFSMADAIAELQHGKDFFDRFEIEDVVMDFAEELDNDSEMR
jgi:hypothetical protein